MLLRVIANLLRSNHPLARPTQIAFHFTDQDHPRQKREKKIFKNEEEGSKKSFREKDASHSLDLIKLIRNYRGKMGQSEDKLKQLCYHSKMIANYYKRNNHYEFTEQKSQIQAILTTITEVDYSHLQLPQYFSLLDFLRVCFNIETISNPIYSRAKDKIFGLFALFEKGLEALALGELATFYCKVTPLAHPEAFKVSGMLHDVMANEAGEKGEIGLGSMQLYVIVRAMGKKEFLSFPDKKILEMILGELKRRNISDLVVQVATALKDIQLEANISDVNVLRISQEIQERAVRLTRKGLPYSQIDHLINTRKSDNPYFAQIFAILARRAIENLNKEEVPFGEFKRLVGFARLIPNCSLAFTTEERKLVIKHIEDVKVKRPKEGEGMKLEFDLLDLLRTEFFGEDLNLLDALFLDKSISFFWTFPFEYSRLSAVFPLTIIEPRISENTAKFKTQISNLRIAVSIAAQAKLHPESQTLQKCYEDTVQSIKTFRWGVSQLEILIRIAISDTPLISLFHHHFHHLYLPELLPTPEEVRSDQEVRRGERSSLLRLWQYLLVQEVPHDLLSKVPLYAIYVSCFREKRIKNQEVIPKLSLLLAISHKLSSGMIKFSDPESGNIIEVLAQYSSVLCWKKERVVEAYWRCVGHLLDQYASVRRSSLPLVNFLFARLLTLELPKFRHSLYYQDFLAKLLAAIGLMTITNAHSYFRTSIIRQALRTNSLSDLHLPHLEVDYFSPQEKDLLAAVVGRYEPTEELSSANLAPYLKLSRLQHPPQLMEKVLAIIEGGSVGELAGYLTHFSFEMTVENEKILSRLGEEFMRKLDLSVNMLPLLRNLTQIESSHFELYRRIVVAICDKLLTQMDAIYLADHSEILTLLRHHSISHQQYEEALWNLACSPNSSSASLDIILHHLRRNPRNHPLEGAREMRLVHPERYLEFLVYQQEELVNFKEEVSLVVDSLDRPIPRSLIVAYLESKCELLIAKSKVSSPFLHKPNATTAKLIKLLRHSSIRVEAEEKKGESIYHIGDRIILIFTKEKNANESRLALKMMGHLYPNQKIMDLSVESTLQDHTYFLNQLSQIDRAVFSSEVVERVERELHL